MDLFKHHFFAKPFQLTRLINFSDGRIPEGTIGMEKVQIQFSGKLFVVSPGFILPIYICDEKHAHRKHVIFYQTLKHK